VLLSVFDDCQVLRAEMRVRLFTGKDRKTEKTGRRNSCSADTVGGGERVVARHSGEISVQLVVGFRNRLPSAVVKTPVNSARADRVLS